MKSSPVKENKFGSAVSNINVQKDRHRSCYLYIRILLVPTCTIQAYSLKIVLQIHTYKPCTMSVFLNCVKCMFHTAELLISNSYFAMCNYFFCEFCLLCCLSLAYDGFFYTSHVCQFVALSRILTFHDNKFKK